MTTIELTTEARKAIEYLARLPAGNTTLDRGDLRSLLGYTGGQALARGHLYDIRSRSLGAGVYRVSLSRWQP